MKTGNKPNKRLHLTDDIWNQENVDWYVREYGEHPVNRMTAERAALAADDWVLDIGCGSGAALRAASGFVTGGALIGVDPSDAMLAAARELSSGSPAFGRMRFLKGSAEDLPLSRDLLSVCWAINSLHHWHDIPAGLMELQRVLKPGGRLIIVEEIFEEEDRGISPDRVLEHLSQAGFRSIRRDIMKTPDSDMTVFEMFNGREG